jgi:peptidoglycan/LPS O-acetylase OafA/YrhL
MGATMSKPWFRAWGWIYVPVSWQGAVVTILMLAFWVNTFLAVDRHSHSASDTLYGTFPYVVCSLVIAVWIAHKTSRMQ